MGRQWIIGLIMTVDYCWALTTGYGLDEEITKSDEIQDNTMIPEEASFQDGVSEDEISKRRLDTASKTFSKLKSTFFRLAKPRAKRPTTRRFRWSRFRLWRKPKVTPAPIKLDMVFVMDKSGSVGPHNFNLEKKFVEKLTEHFDIFPAKTRVAVVSYSTSVKLEFNFKEYINKECLQKGILDIIYTGGATAIGPALQYVRNNLIFNAAAGARSGAKKVVFLLTDGRSNRGVNPSIPASQLKASGVVMFALGVSNSVRQSELLAIASSTSHVLQVDSFATLNQVTNKIQGDLSKKCINGMTVYDACERRCQCQSGKLVKCCRRRKEFTDMTNTERVRYINTVKIASTNPAYKPQYDTLLTLHSTIFDTSIHALQFFLPWHRWFILQYENLLQEIDCRVTVPYWDWSLVWADPWSSDMWNTGANGFGGNGVPGGSCVNSGPFRSGVWWLPTSAGGGCLTREFSGTAPNAIAVQTLISTNPNPSDFLNFEELLRVEFHNNIHCIINGTMCTINSASAPEFFLHHGFIDKIWWDWQSQGNAHKFHTYFHTQAGLMSTTPHHSRDFLDLNNQKDCVCAEYVQPTTRRRLNVRSFGFFDLTESSRRMRLPPLSSKAIKLFKISPDEVRRVERLRAKMKLKVPVGDEDYNEFETEI